MGGGTLRFFLLFIPHKNETVFFFFFFFFQMKEKQIDRYSRVRASSSETGGRSVSLSDVLFSFSSARCYCPSPCGFATIALFLYILLGSSSSSSLLLLLLDSLAPTKVKDITRPFKKIYIEELVLCVYRYTCNTVSSLLYIYLDVTFQMLRLYTIAPKKNRTRR